MTECAVSLFTKQRGGRREIRPNIKTMAGYWDNESSLCRHKGTPTVHPQVESVSTRFQCQPKWIGE